MLSIIIVNYLQKDFLLNCVTSINKNLPGGSYEVIIVNNSAEEDLSDLADKFKEIKIIPNENNGYSHANNLGARHSNCDYLLFLNADTEILNDFTRDLFNHFRGIENYGAVGLRLEYPDGTFQNSFGLFPTILNEYKNRKVEIAFRNKDSSIIRRREKKFSAVKQVDWLSGAAIFIKKDVFNAIKGFDERFFLYYEDIDLCYRLFKEGYTNYYFPSAEIIHHKGENTRKEIRKNLKKIQKTSQSLYYKLHNDFVQNITLKLIHIFK